MDSPGPVHPSGSDQRTDFEAAESGWTLEEPSGWSITFPSDAGNPGGAARIVSGGSGTGGIVQNVVLPGDPSETCHISFQWAVPPKSALFSGFTPTEHSATFTCRVDGEVVYDLVFASVMEWRSVSVELPCGEHAVAFFLGIDFINYEVLVDNVTDSETVPVRDTTWGKIKRLY